MTPATSWLALQGTSAKADAMIHKLNKRPEFELYTLTNDPHELTNQANNPEYEPVLTEMKAALLTRLTALNDLDPVATEKTLIKGKGKGTGPARSRSVKSGKK